MATTEITPANLAELNRAWRLLAGLTNELDMALQLGEATPEQRLAKVAALVAFVRARMPRQVPASVVAEDAHVAQLAGATTLEHSLAGGEPEALYTMGPDGEFSRIQDAEAAQYVPLTDDEVARWLSED